MDNHADTSIGFRAPQLFILRRYSAKNHLISGDDGVTDTPPLANEVVIERSDIEFVVRAAQRGIGETGLEGAQKIARVSEMVETGAAKA